MSRYCVYSSLWATLVFAAATEWTPAAESPSDAALPVREGLELWLDAARIAEPAPATGETVARWRDQSGNRRDLVQDNPAAQPTYQDRLAKGTTPVVRFDGMDDWLGKTDLDLSRRELTIFVVAAPHSNGGWFRAILSANKRGANDYTTGINIDQSGNPTGSFNVLSVEGAGFAGTVDLLTGDRRFGTFHVIAVTCRPDKEGVRLAVNGKPHRARNRTDSPIALDELRLGSRYFSNTADPAQPHGFFHGDVAEVLVYGRALSDDQRAQVEAYLAKKHAALLALAGLPAENPIKMLVPGFSVRELPIELTNINDAAYTADGRLFALGYDGRIHVLRDTDGDGLEDKVTAFWDKPTLKSPIGMVLAPEGVYVSSVGKISLFKDADGDNRADSEEIVATGWDKPDNYSGGVDALGLARDRDGSLYFALGCHDYTNAYRLRDGKSRYRTDSERGAVLKVSPDRKRREVFCSGVRFGVALAFNREGDLFATDQEGETWLPGGNPLDELLHIQPGKHYGFPPRHPQHLPDVVDAPATVEFGPQHQSTCGLIFNEPVAEGGRQFGPAFWRGDAIVAGYSRGKLWRVPLVKTSSGYTGRPILIACLKMLTLATAIDPAGNLLVMCHSGAPDWGSGPSGDGHLFKIAYTDPTTPQPQTAWSASSLETRIRFDRPLDPSVPRTAVNQEVAYGDYIRAGDRHEAFRPGYYAVIDQQQRAFRGRLRVVGAGLTDDGRTLVLRTDPKPARTWYAMTIPGVRGDGATAKAETLEFDFFLDDPQLPRPPRPETTPRAGSPLPPQFAGGNRVRGETVFHGEKARCGACHLVRGKGARIGPDLSNLVHRDATSVLRDITEPSAAINPDYVPYKLLLHDGRALTGLVRAEDGDRFRVTDNQAKEHIVHTSEIDQLVAERVSIMPDGVEKQLSPGDLKDLMAFLLAPAPPEEPKGVERPPQRTKKEVEAALKAIAAPEKPPEKLPDKPPREPKPLNVLLVWGIKDHGPGEHDYPRWQREWSALLAKSPAVNVRTVQDWPDESLFAWPHAILFYHMHQGYDDARYKQLDAYQGRGGGLVILHSAVAPRKEPEKLAERIGLSWKWGTTKFRHGPLDLNVADHELTRGLPKSFRLVDETYWPMHGDLNRLTVVATAKEEGREHPMLWTYEREKARVLGCILGHYYWTFDDPLFRILLLRGIAWTARQPLDRFNTLVTDGVKLAD
jgi:putative heme-binding domain-containing protein